MYMFMFMYNMRILNIECLCLFSSNICMSSPMGGRTLRGESLIMHLILTMHYQRLEGTHTCIHVGCSPMATCIAHLCVYLL